MSQFVKEELDRKVFAYLKKNNFKDAAKAMEKHTNAILDVNLGGHDNSDGVDGVDMELAADIANQTAAFTSDVSPQAMEEAYSSLTKWVENSLDQYKNELYMIVYPIFIHTYLDLLYRGKEEEAENFMINHQHEHADTHGHEIQNIIGVRTLEQMKTNTTVNLFRTQKYRVKMCTHSHELLFGFLHEHNFNSILNMLNQHIDVSQTHGNPSQHIDHSKIGHALNSDACQETVNWGLYNALDLEEDDYDDDDNQSAVSKRSKRTAVTTILAKKGMEENKPKKSRRIPDHPKAPHETQRLSFPPVHSRLLEIKKQMVKDAQQRVHLSGKALPSCCMYTFFNALKVTTLSFSADGKMIAGGCSDSSVRVWTLTGDKLKAVKKAKDIDEKDIDANATIEKFLDEDTASIMKVLRAHSSPVSCVSFTPDNLFLLSASVDCTVRLWSLLTFTNVVSYRGHTYPVWHVSFSPLSLYFVTASHDRTARFFSTNQIFTKRVFAGHLLDVNVSEFHPNAAYVATGSADKTCRLWEITTGKCVRVFQGHRDSVHTLAFTNDGRFLASGADDWDVIVWDLENGSRVKVLHGHSDVIYTLKFSIGDTVLASGGADNSVRIWDCDFLKRAAEATVTIDEEDDKEPGEESLELAATYRTKDSPVYALHFGSTNYLLAAGVFVKNPDKH
eukprot:m.28325 g.28325  ORF g.28325 m.28325 type:complete len:673 (-) comp9461_c0_seq2:54-2072(-)